jgi:hypothetical protein
MSKRAPSAPASIADLAKHGISIVQGLAGDIHLRHQLRQSSRCDGEVDMRRPAGIGHRADGPEAVAAFRIGRGAPIALEALVVRPAAIR